MHHADGLQAVGVGWDFASGFGTVRVAVTYVRIQWLPGHPAGRVAG